MIENNHIDDLNDIVFQPFDCDDKIDDWLDPDCNFYECISNLECTYYQEHQFSEINKSRSKLSLLHHNIRSAPKNLEQLMLYIKSLDFQFTVIGLSETWLNESTKDLYGIPNYVSINECRQDKRGGGVSLFIQNSVQFNVRTDLNQFNENIESIFIEMDGKSIGKERNVIVGVIYRPPNTDISVFNEHLTTLLSAVKLENKLCYCMGDYNINIMNSESHGDTGKFLDIMYSFSFIPLITRPTRVAINSATIIDNIFSNDIAYCNTQSQGIFYTDISDHFPIFVILKSNVHDNMKHSITKRCINEESIKLFKGMLDETNWNLVLNQEDTQTSYTLFADTITSLYNKAFPLKSVKVGNRPYHPWMTEGIKQSVHCKNKLYLLYKKKNTAFNEIRYKLYKNRLKHTIIAAKKMYYQRLLSENKSNLKQSWKILKDIIGKGGQRLCNTQFLIDDVLVTDKNVIANRFNEFYSNIGPSLAQTIPVSHKNPEDYLKGNYVNSMFLNPVDEVELCNVMSKLRNSASGLDNLRPEIIKRVCLSIVQPLVHIFNLSFKQGVFPSEIKSAKPSPLDACHQLKIGLFWDLLQQRVQNFRTLGLPLLVEK